MDYVEGKDFVEDKPKNYDYWAKFVPKLTPAWSGKLLDLSYSNPQTLQPRTLGFDPRGISTGNTLNLWLYRRIVNRNNFKPGTITTDVTLVNWPQNDYRSEEHTSELQSRENLVCRLLLEKKN